MKTRNKLSFKLIYNGRLIYLKGNDDERTKKGTNIFIFKFLIFFDSRVVEMEREIAGNGRGNRGG